MSEDKRLEILFWEWLEALSHGKVQTPEAYCASIGRSDLAERLLAFIRDRSQHQQRYQPTLDLVEVRRGESNGNTDGVLAAGAASTLVSDGGHGKPEVLEAETQSLSDRGSGSRAGAVSGLEGIAGRLPVLDGLTIERVLGAGGMGVVYLAVDRELKRQVAVKMIHAHRVDAHTVDRFLAEARSTAQVQHENFVPVYRIGTAEGVPYFVLEYVKGGPLSSSWKREPQDPRKVAAQMRTLAMAMEHAHQGGIVHRDLKPHNVLVSEKGALKITDFGLAKLGSSELTEEGQLLGTPAYMAPEQATQSSTAGFAADIYSLGVMLYEGLTGRTPFTAPTAIELLDQLLHATPVSVRTLQPSVPKDLETICMKCLEKLPAGRYASAQALADDLGRYLDEKPILAAPPSAIDRMQKFVKRNRILVAGTAATILALLLGTIGTSIGLYQALEAGKVAEQNLEKAKEEAKRADLENRKSQNSLGLFLAAFRNIDADQAGREVKVVDIVDPAAKMTLGTEASEDIPFDLSDDETRQAFATVLGSVYESLGLYENALPLHQLALRLSTEKERAPYNVILTIANDLAHTLDRLGRTQEGIEVYETWLEKWKADLPVPNRDLLAREVNFTRLLENTSRRGEIEERFADIARRAREVPDMDEGFFKFLNASQISVDQTQESGDDEVAQLEALIREYEASGEILSANGIAARTNLGITLCLRGNFKRGSEIYRQALKDAQDKLGPDHADIAGMIGTLAGLCMQEHKHAEALALHDEMLGYHRARFGDQHPQIVEALVVSGAALIALERFEEAEKRLADSLPGVKHCIESGIFPDAYRLPTFSHYGAALMANGKLEEAKPYLLESYDEIKLVADKMPIPFLSHLPVMANRVAEYWERNGDTVRAKVAKEEGVAWEAMLRARSKD